MLRILLAPSPGAGLAAETETISERALLARAGRIQARGLLRAPWCVPARPLGRHCRDFRANRSGCEAHFEMHSYVASWVGDSGPPYPGPPSHAALLCPAPSEPHGGPVAVWFGSEIVAARGQETNLRICPLQAS